MILRIFLVAVILLIIAALSVTYTVHESEQVVITRFGEPLGDTKTEAGLYFKIPFAHEVNRFEKRILQWDEPPRRIVTVDKKRIMLDTMGRWRITNARLFLESVRDIPSALTRIDDIVSGAVRDIVSTNLLIEVLRTSDREMTIDFEEESTTGAERQIEVAQIGREELSDLMLERSRPQLREMGIELIDVKVKRLIYVESVLRDVYDRMITERRRVAARYRSEGEAQRARIEGELERDLKEITSGAFRTAEEIRGQAEAEAAKVYADAYSKDAEFYAFLKTLETYRSVLDGDTTLVLSTDSELFRLLGGEAPLPGSDGD